MRTINQFIYLYNSVLNGISIDLFGHTISSDGINWTVDGIPVDTLKNKLSTLNFVIKKCELAKELIEKSGLDGSKLYDEYFIVLDTLDGMMMLVSDRKSQLTFVYMVSTSVVIEKIDKEDFTMQYELFNFEGNVINRKKITGKLSKKSIKKITDMDKKGKINITQNFFYDMLLEGMTTYSDLLNANATENEACGFQKKL